MNKKISISLTIVIIFLAGVMYFLNIENRRNNCIVENPDPDGYLVKICKYIKIKGYDVAPADPIKYKIKTIEDGEYSRWEDHEEITTEAIVVRLNCCFLGDIAYFDKNTKEVIGFDVGDL